MAIIPARREFGEGIGIIFPANMWANPVFHGTKSYGWFCSNKLENMGNTKTGMRGIKTARYVRPEKNLYIGS